MRPSRCLAGTPWSASRLDTRPSPLSVHLPTSARTSLTGKGEAADHCEPPEVSGDRQTRRAPPRRLVTLVRVRGDDRQTCSVLTRRTSGARDRRAPIQAGIAVVLTARDYVHAQAHHRTRHALANARGLHTLAHGAKPVTKTGRRGAPFGAKIIIELPTLAESAGVEAVTLRCIALILA